MVCWGFPDISCTQAAKVGCILILIGVDAFFSWQQRNAFFGKIVFLWGKNLTFASKIVCHEEANKYNRRLVGASVIVWLMCLFAVEGHAQSRAPA